MRIATTGLVLFALTAAAATVTPNTFEPNRGQAASQARFIARFGSEPVILTGAGSVVAGQIRLDLVSAKPDADATGFDPQPGVSNYLIGSNRARWTLDVPHFGKVRFHGIYPGIDVVYYFNGRDLEHDFVVAPGADWTRIRFRVDEAKVVRIEENGDLSIETPTGTLHQKKPIIYQEIEGRRQAIPGSYVVREGREFGFSIGAYDTERPLVIDPVIVFSTYLGGNGSDLPKAMVIDSQNNVYVTGATTSTNFPTNNAVSTHSAGGTDVFVTKLDGNSGAIIYSTYIGGSGSEVATRIRVDASGSAYVVGSTNSTDFPTVKAVQSTLNGSFGAFVLKLNSGGNSLVYSTYLSGSNGAAGRGISLDSKGSAYVVGETKSADFPVKGTGFGNFFHGMMDGFIAKLSPDGSSLVYSGFLGGKGSDWLESVAVNSLGEANVVGWTNSQDLPTTPDGSRWPQLAGKVNGFMAKISANGIVIEYISYFGGSLVDFATSIVADPRDNFTVYIVGEASSPDLPTESGAPFKQPDGHFLPYLTSFVLPGAGGALARSPSDRVGSPRAMSSIDDFHGAFPPDPDEFQFDPWDIPPPPPPDDYFPEPLDLPPPPEDPWMDLPDPPFDLPPPPPDDVPDIPVGHNGACSGCGATGKLRGLTGAAAVPTVYAKGVIYQRNALTGARSTVPQPPVSATGSSSIRGLAMDASGNIYVAMQTNDSTFPVSAAGAHAGSSNFTGYVVKINNSQSSGPAITTVTNAFGGSTTLAPNTWVAIKGSGLAPQNDSRTWQGSDFINSQMPTQLDGVSVKMNGQNAYVWFISPAQINVLTPPNLTSGPVQVTVTNGSATSSAFTVQAAPTSLSMFVFGGGPYLLGTHLNGSDIGPTTLYPGLTTPAKPGEQIVLYGNGFGATSVPVVAGSSVQSGSLSPLPNVQIGGQYAPVTFAGLVAPGLYQINVQVPNSLPNGDNPVTVQYNGATVQSGLMLTIQQ